MKFSLPLRRNSTHLPAARATLPLLWIPNPRILDILTIQVIEKISQTRVCKLLLVPFPLGAEFAGFSGFLDSLSQSPWGAAGTGVSVHWCLRS